MSEFPPAPTPKKEVIAPRRESIAEEFADDPLETEHNYGDARLWLAARDPRCLFAYWEFRADEHPDAIGDDGRAHFFLRIHRAGSGEGTIEIEPGSANAFIPVESPDSDYSAELGFFSGGIWCFFARSGIARTPPEISAAHGPAVFATIPASISLGKFRDALAHSALPGESVAMTAARIQSDARRHGEWTPEHERLLAEILGENAASAETTSANSFTLTQRIQKKLQTAAIAAAPFAPIPAPHGGGDASSSASSWPTSPGTTSHG
jgi:hypothetical protein